MDSSDFTDDFLAATGAAATRSEARSIYHLGDDGRQTRQDFLDQACGIWSARKPWLMLLNSIYFTGGSTSSSRPCSG